MGPADMARVAHVVADTGAFLSAAPLQDLAQTLYTVPEVLAEIRDRRARRRLAALPCELRLRRPRPDLLRLVTEFSKKTGDYPSLSAADLQVLALTCQLQAETDGPDCLRWEPQDKVQVSSTPQHPEAPVHLAGFHLPSKHKHHGKGQHQPGTEGSTAPSESDEFSSFLYWRVPLPSIEEELQELLSAQGISVSPGATEEHQRAEHEGSADEEEDEESDDEGWITPSNLKQVQQDMGHCDAAPDGIQVGCVTTDFAMQNVLLQMGLHVLAVNGMLIRQARSYILRCHGCFRTTSDMTKVFCPHCGNKTLKKVAVSVSDDGTLHMHFSRNPKVLNPRGLRYPLPAPRGGKHANNPHLVADQPFPQQRLSRKARQKTNVFDPDYIARASPFAENDIYSRAANLQIRDAALGAGRRRLNPNAVTKKFVKRR
ncbi:RNA-binding protein NOB1 [Melopsittacus undulatus]|uniref:RNA-binding protein NOB1 n=1 Tax=Melopsittacus undulatus TaxID=13146 RepID=A0A8C6K3M6_MELUD|nr:RNA-binding protein NOB1 [Melopsittacus undulatus]